MAIVNNGQYFTVKLTLKLRKELSWCRGREGNYSCRMSTPSGPESHSLGFLALGPSVKTAVDM